MVSFPITGEYRQVLIVLESIVAIIFIEFSGYFFYKYSQNKKKSIPSHIELNWAILFLTFSVGGFLFMIEEFLYVHRPLIISIAYLSLCIGGLIFSYRIESSKELNTKYFFTILGTFILFIILIIFLILPSELQTFAPLLGASTYILLFLYFTLAISKIWGNFKLLSIGFFFGLMSWFIGFTLTSAVALEIFQTLFIRVIGNILMIVGTICLGIFVSSLPSLDEIGWQDNIKYIIITTKSGKCLYNENIKTKKEINEVLLGGYLSGLQLFIQTTFKDKSSLKGISKEKESFLMQEGKHILAIMIVERELELLKYHLRKLVEKFEDFYGETLKEWKGDTVLFKPTKYLLRDVIPLKKKK